jgi:hypothetical protein
MTLSAVLLFDDVMHIYCIYWLLLYLYLEH